ncbi:molybdopterin-containing oxidoreductase family protein [Mariluticola halotolerans]|uniref:molybdopterin-containing oxidoreductase family protein n=1 Tax=Mariluticola halotolerans TaxID=2909283 RepID=UPI0026E1932D|nr:molybdopterin-dependent oxidoreductase [Mariluticola halotolerans]UJQ95149.1 molybdopterin-dependent oxidoreductase [Mariluticola halotolerans]
MNKPADIRVARSVCPHDCPSTCALDVEVLDGKTIGRVRGAKDDPYTAGVICEKVARYAERIHNPDRLMYPLKRIGKKGEGRWQRISWDEALDEIVERFTAAETEFGAESIWPFYYAGTMGHVQRDGIDRLRHAKGYSRQYGTICSMIAWGGYVAGTGLLAGVNPEQMADADCVVIWGTNAVHTQVNVMTHAMRAKKERGAKLVVVDVYRNATMDKADMGLVIKPGTDGALALAVLHVLLRDGLADRAYMEKFTDFSPEFEAHVQTRTPEWAAAITGLDVAEIEAFAKLVGTTKRSFFRLGYGFTRQRNGATNMHAALCIPAMTGAWQYQGGGAFHSNSGVWGLDKSLILGEAMAEEKTRNLDMCELGPILTGDEKALKGGGPVKAMLVQNTNPAVVVPDQALAQQGLRREDLFLVVHEQFMTETAELADIVLPATMFLEHHDYYTRGGHTRILYGPEVIPAPGETRSNMFVINELANRLGVGNPEYFGKTDKEMVFETFARSGYEGLDEIEEKGFVERGLPDEKSRFADGFAWPDGKFRFAPNWLETQAKKGVDLVCDPAIMPKFADWWDINEPATGTHPFRLATSPARTYLNTSFNETPGSQKREGKPALMVHPGDADALGLVPGGDVLAGNHRGEVVLEVKLFDGVQRGVVIAEGLHPNKAHKRGKGINTLIGSDPVPPFGGGAFHDATVWLRPLA